MIFVLATLLSISILPWYESFIIVGILKKTGKLSQLRSKCQTFSAVAA